jgi:hypothetical protein
MSATTSTTHATATTSMATTIVRGVIGGIAGGIVFGMLMQMMGMIPMVAMMVGSESVAVGWVIHLAISAVIGASFAVLLGSRVHDLKTGLALGIGYGIVWWVLGALIAMPARIGMPIFDLNTTALQSLMGHVVFGAILGAVLAALGRR